MKYFYRKYRLAKALRIDCRKKGSRQEVSYSVLGSTQKHNAVIAKEGKVIWEIFVDWFAREYMGQFDANKHTELIKDFNSILKDLEKEELVGVEENEKLTIVWMKPGANSFIDGFWIRAVFYNVYVTGILVPVVTMLIVWGSCRFFDVCLK